MYAHERSLVMKYQGRPFVLLGINSDTERGELQHTIDRQRMLWRSWWDGQGGPIVSRWGVCSWPTVYLLDGNGVVRHRLGPVPAEQLEAAIEGLLREQETHTAGTAPAARRS